MLDGVFAPDGRLVAAVAAVLVAGFAKGVTGIGLPIVGVPILVALYGDLRAVLLVTIIATALADLPFVVRGARRARRALFLVGYLVAGLVGVVAGTRLLVVVRPQVLTLLLAFLLSAFVAVSWTGRFPRIDHRVAARWGPLIGLCAGLLQGSTGSSGPLTVSYLVSLDLPRDVFLFAINVIFTVLDYTQLVSLQRLGLYTPRLYEIAAAVVVLSGAGMLAGFAAARHIDDRAFRRGVLIILAVAAASLFVRALRV